MRTLAFLAGLLLLLVPEVLRVYFIMPFPGSQEDMATDLRQVDMAYWLHRNVSWLRLLGVALVAGPALHHLRHGGWGRRLAVLLPLALAAIVAYLFNFRFMADKMFLPVANKLMAPVAQDPGPADDLVLAVERHGEARAYPIELIGYHHQVLDTIGGEAVLVTYCTVCRTGRAFSPVVNGMPETFRLVGMDHFNAMFEDSRTGSWWRQATGACIAGPLKGSTLLEVPSAQCTRGAFGRRYPQGLVMRPDPAFTAAYAGLKDYDEGNVPSPLVGRDTASWRPKSWVVGVVHKGLARAYDWNALMRAGTIGDTLAGDSIVVRLHDDDRTFSAVVAHRAAHGLGGLPASPVPAYQEFWHSWRTFHPRTTQHQAVAGGRP